MTKSKKILKAPLKKPSSIPQIPQSPIVAHYIILIIIAFVAGASIMIIELAAARVLSPWFGNSLYTWTGLIGVILVAMSLGYYLGGWLADRKTDYLTLSHVLAVSSLSIICIPVFKIVIGDSLLDADVMWGPVIASILLFALPGILLGCVSPYVIRLVSLLSEDKQIGLSAGTIFMLSTLGSVFGTFSAGFIFIPKINLLNIFLITGSAISFLSILGYWLSIDTGKKAIYYILILFSLITLLLVILYLIDPEKPKNIVYDKNTFYHRIRVTQDIVKNGDKLTSIFLDTTLEGAQYEFSKEIPIDYQKYWQLSKLFCPKIEKAAFLGGGAFKMPEALLDAYPKAAVDVIEIDPQVGEVGRMFFNVNKYSQMNIIIDDARRYLSNINKQYDLIFGDVYNGVRYIPAHLLTKEFFKIIRTRLGNNGVFMMNLIGAIRGKKSTLFASTYKTIKTEFKYIYVFAIHQKILHNDQNIIIVATNQEINIDVYSILHSNGNKEIKELLLTFVSPEKYDGLDGYMLTDNYNPVEYFIAKLLRE